MEEARRLEPGRGAERRLKEEFFVAVLGLLGRPGVPERGMNSVHSERGRTNSPRMRRRVLTSWSRCRYVRSFRYADLSS